MGLAVCVLIARHQAKWNPRQTVDEALDGWMDGWVEGNPIQNPGPLKGAAIAAIERNLGPESELAQPRADDDGWIAGAHDLKDRIGG
ncbi:MAG TPA: hypothetical protein P5218_15350 [Planctomycetota bacterium]|nr:hypothetical protein [Planctomycetota bacterium]HRV82810.1 hypothetical protein [Planctomycetota bacterium]